MPVYTVSTPSFLQGPDRKKVVDVITDAHCGVTAAPEKFVQVVFAEGIPIDRETCAHVQGSIRAGRNGDMKQEITRQIDRGVSRIMRSNMPTKVVILDVPHTWVMEGGEMMPAPGEEYD